MATELRILPITGIGEIPLELTWENLYMMPYTHNTLRLNKAMYWL